jgi:hypothetical protein
MQIINKAGKQVSSRGVYYSPIVKNIREYRIKPSDTVTVDESRDLAATIATVFGLKAVVSKEEIFDKISRPAGLTVTETEGLLNFATNNKIPFLEKTRIVKTRKAAKKALPVRKRGRPRIGKPLPKFGLDGLVE